MRSTPTQLGIAREQNEELVFPHLRFEEKGAIKRELDAGRWKEIECIRQPSSRQEQSH